MKARTGEPVALELAWVEEHQARPEEIVNFGLTLGGSHCLGAWEHDNVTILIHGFNNTFGISKQ
jgi:hypothetical protein